MCVMGDIEMFGNFHIYLFNKGIYNGHKLCENFHCMRNKKNIIEGRVCGDIKTSDDFHICFPIGASIVSIGFVQISIA